MCKNEVLILVVKNQAWIRVEGSRFVVTLRGSEEEECRKLLESIVRRVKEFSSGVEWVEKITSPHYSGRVDIDVSEAMSEAGVEEEVKRELVCPVTLLPIRAELLLIRAGLFVPSSLPLRPIPPAWWDFHSSSLQEGGDGKGPTTKVTHLVSVYDKTSSGMNPVKNEELYSKFARLFGEMNGDISGIVRVYGVNNPQLRSAFEIKREVIEKQHLYDKGYFRKEGWRSLPDSDQRNRMYLQLSSKIRTFRGEFNDGSHPFVVPMIHGTREDAAFRVIENGYGVVANDGGYFGRGMYFTSDMRYSSTYAREHDPKGHPGVKVFLLAAVLPGNPYPVTEHPFVVPFVTDESIEGDDKRKPNPVGLLGQACKGGYQSHYSVIDTKSFAAPFPTQFDDFEDHEKKRVVSDELVVFEGAQALPLFLFYCKTR